MFNKSVNIEVKGFRALIINSFNYSGLKIKIFYIFSFLVRS